MWAALVNTGFSKLQWPVESDCIDTQVCLDTEQHIVRHNVHSFLHFLLYKWKWKLKRIHVKWALSGLSASLIWWYIFLMWYYTCISFSTSTRSYKYLTGSERTIATLCHPRRLMLMLILVILNHTWVNITQRKCSRVYNLQQQVSLCD